MADAGVATSIANPAQIKNFGRDLVALTKTDGVDSFVLARTAFCSNRIWTPPASEARVLQALLSRRNAIAQDLQREHSR